MEPEGTNGELMAAYDAALTAMRARILRGDPLDTDHRQMLLQELESLVAVFGFEPRYASAMLDAWQEAEAEVDRLRAALRPFATAANPLTGDVLESVLTTLIVTCGDVVRARAALGEEGE